MLLAGLLLGLVVGSFLNVVIYRLPLQLESVWRRDSLEFLGIEAEAGSPEVDADSAGNLLFPASHCPRCRAPIRPWQNIPVLSYLLQRGRCAVCAAPISRQYPLVELAGGLATVWVVYSFGITATALMALVFTWTLIALTGIDINHKLLPDNLTLPLLWLGLLANTQGLFTDLHSAVIGAVAGYMVLWLVFWGFKLLTGKEGMGYGDFKLLAALGAWMGWQMLPLIILLSSLVGALVGVLGILLAGRDRQIPLAFGPFLAAAGWIALFWGDAIVTAYLGYF